MDLSFVIINFDESKYQNNFVLIGRRFIARAPVEQSDLFMVCAFSHLLWK